MKRVVAASSAEAVKLEVMFEDYERFESGNIRRAQVSGVDLLDALKKMVDHMGLYITSEDIEDDEMSAEDVIDSIESSNGDGCDFIFLLKDVTSGKVYIKEGYNDLENWD